MIYQVISFLENYPSMSFSLVLKNDPNISREPR